MLFVSIIKKLTLLCSSVWCLLLKHCLRNTSMIMINFIYVTSLEVFSNFVFWIWRQEENFISRMVLSWLFTKKQCETSQIFLKLEFLYVIEILMQNTQKWYRFWKSIKKSIYKQFKKNHFVAFWFFQKLKYFWKKGKNDAFVYL